MTELADAALDYTRRGYHVLALHHKRPNNKFHENWDYENSIHGTPADAAEEVELRAIFDDPSTTGVAILIPQHMLAADIDTEDAARLYMALAGKLPETVTAKTVKGLHVWSWAPGADQSYWLGQRTLLFKGFGGYVAAPPSRHFTQDGVEDGVYTWLEDFDTGFDSIPDAIWANIQVSHSAGEMSQAFRDDAKASREWIEVQHDDAGKLVLIRRIGIEGVIAAVTNAKEGNRNNMLAWASMTCQEEGVPFDKAYELLMAAARSVGLQTDESRTTIKSAYRRRRTA